MKTFKSGGWGALEAPETKLLLQGAAGEEWLDSINAENQDEDPRLLKAEGSELPPIHSPLGLFPPSVKPLSWFLCHRFFLVSTCLLILALPLELIQFPFPSPLYCLPLPLWLSKSHSRLLFLQEIFDSLLFSPLTPRTMVF